jgi:integrase
VSAGNTPPHGRATASNLRDHTIISLALGTGLRLAEIVGLNVGDVFAPDGTPRVRVRGLDC